jgi:hypothetical protein
MYVHSRLTDAYVLLRSLELEESVCLGETIVLYDERQKIHASLSIITVKFLSVLVESEPASA